MTEMSLGQSVRRTGRTTAGGAIKFGQFSRYGSRYLIDPVREPLHVGNFIARPQESAGGFVDYLMGRGTRHPR
jgi:hypothetical protein